MCVRLQVLGDFLELVDRASLLKRQRADRLFEAMVEVILDQGLLCLRDGLFDRMELLGDVETGPARFDHLDDAPEMAFGNEIGPLKQLRPNDLRR